jgi:predicted DNA-binding transcriptional regulator YafY
MLETSVRLLRLLALLQSRPGWSGAELADRLGVTTRTVRNDVERLRLLGYQVRSAPGVAGGYRMGAGAALPPLLLDDEEAVAVAVSLHAAAGGTVTGIEETSLRALAKLERMVPARLRHRIGALRETMLAVPGHGPTVDAATLTAIAAAIGDRVRLRFDYRDHGGTVTVRAAEPHHLVHTGRRWYVLAWDCDREAWRSFRADRLALRTPDGPRFTARQIPGGDPAAFVLGAAGAPGWRWRARVRLHAPAETIAERLAPAAGLVTPLEEGHCLLETGGGTLRDLTALLTGLDVAFTVMEPPELREHLYALAARYEAAAGR